MAESRWTVVKVGGSLFDLPDLGVRLDAWLARLDAARVLLIPGGGATANAIRMLDRVHQLGAEASHWLAIQALSINARFLQALLQDAALLNSTNRGAAKGRLHILDAHPFFRADEENADHLPHAWDVTSDSLAVRAAALLEASELILLKSVAWKGSDWSEAERSGIVDRYFVEALRPSANLRVRIVNLREA